MRFGIIKYARCRGATGRRSLVSLPPDDGERGPTLAIVPGSTGNAGEAKGGFRRIRQAGRWPRRHPGSQEWLRQSAAYVMDGTALLAGSCRGRLLLGFLLLAGQTRLATLGEFGNLDVLGGGRRFDSYPDQRGHFANCGAYRLGGADQCAIFFLLLLVCHEYPRSLCPPPTFP